MKALTPLLGPLLSPLRIIVQAPRYGDNLRLNDQALVLHQLLLFLTSISLILGLGLAAFLLGRDFTQAIIFMITAVLLTALFFLLRAGAWAVPVVGITLTSLIFVLITLLMLLTDGIRHGAVVAFIVGIALATVLGGVRGGTVAFVAAAAIIAVVYVLDTNNISLFGTFDMSHQEQPNIDDLLIQVLLFFVVAVLLQANRQTELRAQRDQQTLSQELAQQQATLEEQVTEQTRELALNLDISQRLSTYLDVNQLVREVVTQVQSAYDFYHVHIYLFDETKQVLRMVGGTGEAGQALLARGHHIPVTSKGLVRRAALSNQPVLVNNTVLDADWLPNPLLPDTKSELAVPIALGENVLGVLDMQENRVNAFTENQVALLQALTAQIAVTLGNAQLYTETRARARFETLTSTINRRLQTATSVDELLALATEELGRALGAPQTAVQIETAALQQLSTPGAQS